MCATGEGGNIASLPWWEQRGEGFGPSLGASAKRYGRREVIRERLSSRHCEGPKNADGPPDGVVRRKPAVFRRGPARREGGGASHLKAFARRRHGT